MSALSDPTVSRRLRDNGQDIYPPDQQTPQALATLQKVEIEKWWPIIKAAGIKAEWISGSAARYSINPVALNRSAVGSLWQRSAAQLRMLDLRI